ncbi:MAG: glycosyltransferase family 39 protein [Chloroflexi bacterium]|nr:glycosyltransferase family 39 protein [Chloroflexota bacterium]
MAERLVRLWAAALLLLFACLLQFSALTRDQRFLPDEAHFMTFARRAAVQGDWLLPGALDKPPLSIYLSAISMVFVGVTSDANGLLRLDAQVGEFAGKLPNSLGAVLAVALMTRLGAQIGGGTRGALLAGLLTACSPYLLMYGGSAFTDMSLLCFGLAAVSCGLSQRWAWSGALLGLAFCCKPQALFLLPLLLMLPLYRRAARSAWLRMILAMLLVCALLLLWDAARPETSLFQLAAANNLTADIIASPGSWRSRLVAWLAVAGWLLGPPLISGIFVAVALLNWRKRQERRIVLALLTIVAAFIATHSFLNLNLYARYLLLILPPLVLFVACSISSRRRFCIVVALLACTGVLWTLQQGSPLEESRSQHAGIDALAGYLNPKPVATVIYDPWLGWQLDYYLGAWHDKRRVHYPTAHKLAAGAAALDERDYRYFVAPVGIAYEPWLAALQAQGFAVEMDFQSENYLAWRLQPALE